MELLPIGSAVTLSYKFRGNPTFSVAPTYNVIRADDTTILAGLTTVSSSLVNGWDVNITIPINFVTTTGGETITVEVFGIDSDGKIRSVEEEYRLIDTVDPNYTPTGIMVQANHSFVDSIILDRADYTTELSVGVYDYTDAVLLAEASPSIVKITRVADRNTLPDRFSTPKFVGYRYDVEIDGTSIDYPLLTRAAHQIRYSLTVGGKLVKFESHPLYRLNGLWLMHLNSLRSYLDKARLYEIDPTLQWQDDELCQALIDGANYINSHPTDITYWTVEGMPQPLHTLHWMAAAYMALNARYLAEGFTAFEFQGLSTSLTVDRKEAISYKIEELKGYLDTNLTGIKKSAVAVVGVGDPPAGIITPKKALGAMGLNISPANNIIYNGRRRRYQFNGY